MPRGVDELCPTCGEPYSKEPTPRASFCSDGFHMCRDCKRRDGRIVARCRYHHALYGGKLVPGDDPRGQD